VDEQIRCGEISRLHEDASLVWSVSKNLGFNVGTFFFFLPSYSNVALLKVAFFVDLRLSYYIPTGNYILMGSHFLVANLSGFPVLRLQYFHMHWRVSG
jgi:hypothetical protein